MNRFLLMEPLFALGFGAPLLLWGTGLAAAPFILHLLFRRKYREIDWAAMKWLLDALKRNHRRLRMEQWLLLAVRTLLILLVVMAMSRPTLDATNPLLAAATSSATHNVIVFDNSMSMHYLAANQSRWDRAKGMAQAILDDAQKGDLASLVVMGVTSSAVVSDASPYLVAVSEEIDAIDPQYGKTQLDPAMELVTQVLAKSSSARKRVYLITDLQRQDWVGDDESDRTSELGRKLRSISESAEFVILDVGSAESPNLAVSALAQTDPVAVARRGTVFRVELTNFSAADQSDVKVELLVDGQIEGTQRIDLPAGESRSVNFGLTFAEPGDRTVEARIEPDALVADNRAWVVSRVRDSLSVLAIDGEPSGEPFRSETDYLKVALAPSGGEAQPGLVRAETRLESDLLEANLADWDVVVLSNVSQLTPSELAVLTDYLRQGGGVLFFLGSQVNVAAYNEMLFQDGKGIFPLRLLGQAGDPQNKDNPFSFDPMEYAHPLIAAFRDHEQAGLLSTRIYRYTKTELGPESAAQVALRYNSGDPAVVLQRFGRGMVGVVTTTADLDWNTWPISPSYVPVIQEMVLQLVVGRVSRDRFHVGETIAFPTTLQQGPTRIEPPKSEEVDLQESGSDEPVRIQEVDGVSMLQFDGTDLSGIYKIKTEGSQSPPIAVAVNIWPEEGNLSVIVPEELRSTFPGWEFRISDRFTSPRGMATSAAVRSGEFSRLLLYAALMMVFMETFMAWRFGHHSRQ